LNIVFKIGVVLMCCCFLTGAAGCGSSKPSAYYLLTSLPEVEATAARSTTSLSLSIGPVNFPEYLDRKQLFTRSDKDELIIREFSRWGEPLQDSFQRVLIINLSVLLATSRVYEFGNRDIEETDFRLLVDVRRFDVTDDGQGTLVVFWSLNDGQGKQLQRNKSVLYKKGQSFTDRDIVRVLNSLLTDFSSEVAGAVLAVN